MTETKISIGADARCTDGRCGQVTRVAVDPVARVVTHLVVEPDHRLALGRLVPLGLVDATNGEIRLRCTLAEFEKFEYAEETQFLPTSVDLPGYNPGQVLTWPYYPLGGRMGLGVGNVSQQVVVDRVPLGEVTVRRGQQVHATDGPIGRIQGLVIDPGDGHVTHVLLQEGHLWGRREVAIPISAVVGVENGIRLDITKQQVQDLPPVELDRSHQ